MTTNEPADGAPYLALWRVGAVLAATFVLTAGPLVAPPAETFSGGSAVVPGPEAPTVLGEGPNRGLTSTD